MKEIITIAGLPGSGKSSTAKAVAKELGYRHFSSGDLFRQIAAERGLSVEAMNLTAEAQKDIDHRVDELLRGMYVKEEQIVIDSRMAWHWMPESFKVFLTLDAQTAAERVYSQVQAGVRVSEHAHSVDEMRESIERRFASEQKRYMDLYGVDPTTSSNFDLVVDTAATSLEETIRKVLDTYVAWQSSATRV